MVENAQRPEKHEPRGEVATLDLSKYQSGELADRIVEVISIPKAFGGLILTTLLLVVLWFLVVYLLFANADIANTYWYAVCAYALTVGVVLGIVLGILRLVSRGIRGIGGVLEIVLEITDQAASDYDALQTGDTRMPTGSELIEQVSDEVVLPAAEKSLSGALGFLANRCFGPSAPRSVFPFGNSSNGCATTKRPRQKTTRSNEAWRRVSKRPPSIQPRSKLSPSLPPGTSKRRARSSADS